MAPFLGFADIHADVPLLFVTDEPVHLSDTPLEGWLALGLFWFACLLFAASLLDSLFSSRAAYLHLGAIIGTVMVANVFVIMELVQKTQGRNVQEIALNSMQGAGFQAVVKPPRPPVPAPWW